MPKVYRYECLTEDGNSGGYAYATSIDEIKRKRAEHLRAVGMTWAKVKEENCWGYEVIKFAMTMDGIVALLHKCGSHANNG